MLSFYLSQLFIVFWLAVISSTTMFALMMFFKKQWIKVVKHQPSIAHYEMQDAQPALTSRHWRTASSTVLPQQNGPWPGTRMAGTEAQSFTDCTIANPVFFS